MNLKNFKELIRLRHEASDNQKQYWCYDFKLLKNYTKDSRDYAEKHGQELLHGTAVIITSHLSRFILNTFMKLKKADIPLKAFKTKDDAVNWLLQLKKSNQLNGIY